MFKHVALAFICAALVNSPSPAETLNGQVSLDRNVSGDSAPLLNEETAKLDANSPATDARDSAVQLNQGAPMTESMPQSIYNRQVTITINQYRTPQVDMSQLFKVMRRRRQENTAGRLEKLESEDPRVGDALSMLQVGNVNQQVSALGVGWSYPSGAVEFVDPASDLSGKLAVGDRILAVDGLPPIEAHRTGSNFGNAGDIAQVTFSHEGVVQTLPCKRQPIANFTQIAQTRLNWGALQR